MADCTRGLFEIRAIILDTGEVLDIQDVIADGEKEALFESDLKEKLKSRKLTLDDVHVLVREFGQVPAKEKAKYVKVLGKLGKTIVGRESKKGK